MNTVALDRYPLPHYVGVDLAVAGAYDHDASLGFFIGFTSPSAFYSNLNVLVFGEPDVGCGPDYSLALIL